MVWNGKALPKSSNNVVSRRFGYPELVEVYANGMKVFKIYGKGWNIKENRICQTEKSSCSGSKLTSFTEIEGLQELPKNLPRSLTMRYWSTRRYKNGNVHHGYWSDYVKDGRGTMNYANRTHSL
mmetsp:Transcript_67074/g.129725  ORF Transcript_67074/g.129725 Transcript_67074/m.129725 type:complete len:124 (-) Transcript_67074:819-1190(-)